MYCRYCGEEISDDDVYCPNCGELVWFPELDREHLAGNKVTPKKKKRRILVAVLIIIAVIAALAVGGYFLYTNVLADGTLEITSVPQGASVTVDGISYGVSSVLISVSSRLPHTVTVTMDGYEPWSESVTVKAQEKRMLSPVLSPTPDPDSYLRTYNWYYDGMPFSVTVSIPKDKYEKYRRLGHSTISLTKYPTEEYNRSVAKDIAEQLQQYADTYGFTVYQKLMLAATMVQNIPYDSDAGTTGKDEYARYPVETLVDNTGDCEDTSILLAAILRELGYDVLIMRFDGHVALGVANSEFQKAGAYIEKSGKDYFYLETTAPGWELGEIADEYLNSAVDVYVVN